VWASELDLVTMVRNLVDNAICYTPHGGKIDLSVSIKDNRGVMRVKDSGPGIPMAEFDRVFDPFYRTLGGDQVGSGLGLSIVRAISDRLGSEIHLAPSDAATQSGLCVSVLIPIHTAPPKVRDPRPGSVPRQRPTESLL
jgi:two-component system OmpR family sensor kinase